MRIGLSLELIAFLEWVRDEFHRGGRQDEAERVNEMLLALEHELSEASGRSISTARLLQYVDLIVRMLELWRNW